MTTNITLQIPLSKYGPIATLAAAANMPLDSYVVEEAERLEQAKKEGK